MPTNGVRVCDCGVGTYCAGCPGQAASIRMRAESELWMAESQETWRESTHIVEDGVYRITFSRPEQMNALTPTLYGEVKRGVQRAGVRADVDTVVIAGSPGIFAAGGDLKLFLSLLDLPDDDFTEEFGRAYDEPLPFRAILECPKPVITAVDGICLAGGLIMAAASDVVLATADSTFGVPEGRVGLADPFCATLLPLALGISRARYLMLTGRNIDAVTAERWGLVHQVVGAGELDDAVARAVHDLRRGAPEAKTAYKLVANSHVPYMSAEVIKNVASTANGREGLAAFKEKRSPVWRSPGN